jgi:hypothetical protein
MESDFEKWYQMSLKFPPSFETIPETQAYFDFSSSSKEIVSFEYDF